jgi:hypothetical protein
VPLGEIAALGIASKISRCSYKDTVNAFLEEDCDAAIWHDAYLTVYGDRPQVLEKHVNGDSFIRALRRFA